MFIAVHSLSGIMRFLTPSEDTEDTKDTEDKHNLALHQDTSKHTSIISWEKDELEVSFNHF